MFAVGVTNFRAERQLSPEDIDQSWVPVGESPVELSRVQSDPRFLSKLTGSAFLSAFVFGVTIATRKVPVAWILWIGLAAPENQYLSRLVEDDHDVGLASVVGH
jgi:hypothetical protein